MSTALKRLREQNPKMFKSTTTQPMYATGHFPVDYANGYLQEIRDSETGKVIGNQRMLGLMGGSINTIIGRSGVAKTTFCIQAAGEILERYPNSYCIHKDGEISTSWNRILSVTTIDPATIRDKYVLDPEDVTVEGIREEVIKIAKDRHENPKEKIDTGTVDEFGNKVHAYDPVIMIVDSIPTIGLREFVDKEEFQGQTFAMRKARALSDLFGGIQTHIKSANIIMFLINHIKVKNQMIKTQAQVNEMGIDETMPGGEAPVYYANNILRLISSDKYYLAKGDDLDGFLAQVQLVKSRTAPSGRVCELIYEKSVGFNKLRTMLHLAKTYDLLGGRNPKRYLVTHPDFKFDTRDVSTIMKYPDVMKALTEGIIGHLDNSLDILKETEETRNTNKSLADTMRDMMQNLIDVPEQFEEDEVVPEEYIRTA